MTGLPDPFAPDLSNPWLARAADLRRIVDRDAIARDQAGGRPTEQIRLLKEAGLLSLIVPQEFGGQGQPFSTALRITRELARTDGSLGHIYGYHFTALLLSMNTIDQPRSQEILRDAVAGNWFFGNTANSFSPTLFGRWQDDTCILNGFKPFASGSHVADRIFVVWQDEEDETRRWFGLVPGDRAGITIHDDWDGFGQTQTGSGRVSYDNVRIDRSELAPALIDASRPINTLGALQQQSVLLNVFIGAAQGALLAARDYTVTRSRPWIWGGYAKHSDDPWIKRQYGELLTRTRAATALADRALAAMDFALSRGLALTAAERGEAAVTIAAANVLAGEVALEVTSQIFEVMGARSATRAAGFDRFWRNVRIHTLHNPAEYKTLTVGRWALEGIPPEPGMFR